MHRTTSSGPLLAALFVLSSPAFAQGAHRTDPGSQTGEGFGAAIAALGDLDGDGAVDYAVGAPAHDSPGLPDRGRVRVLSGRTGGVLHTIDGPRANMAFGAAIAALGDVTGDRVPDFAIGAPGDLGNSGFVTVRSGATGSEIASIQGSANNRLGHALARIGDSNGDGVADLIVAVALPGIVPRVDYRVHALPSAAVLASGMLTMGNSVGVCMADVGDVTGDGRVDVAVGSRHLNVTEVRLLSPNGSVGLSEIQSWITGNGQPGCVAPAGDIDLDGDLDILHASEAAASAWVLQVNNPSPAQIPAPIANSGFGAAIASIGDHTGDGKPEFVVGAPLALGGAGRVYVYDAAMGTVLAEIDGAAGDGLGAAFARLSDLDGDGYPEFAAARPTADGLAPDSGAVDVRWGQVFGEYAVIGVGCASASGMPTILGVGLPAIGSPVQFRGRQLPPQRPTFAILGLSDQWSGAVPLPLPLDPFGFPGCSLYVSTDSVALTTTNSNGTAARVVAVPNDFALLGRSLFGQFAATVATGSLVVTPGLQARLGR